MKLTQFSLPAFIQDFTPGSPADKVLKTYWTINVSAWMQQATPPSPSFFYDPLGLDFPATAATVRVEWVAFPGRLDQYFSANPPVSPPNPYKLGQDFIYQLADSGHYYANRANLSFPDIPQTICPQADWSGPLKKFGPYGPRGWLDEYCEWSIAYDGGSRILRIDFCCENPEYWTTLWKVNSTRVRELYESTLNHDVPTARKISVALSDLELKDANGKPVIDPETGQPAYNPLNKWNSGPSAVRTGNSGGFTGGAMHLTSTPNTLQTELGLAGGSTPQFQPPGGTGNSDPQALICCGQYGQEYRHSDPHIGQSVNQVVGGQALGAPYLSCLADPVGLYIQQIDPNVFSFGSRIVVGKNVPSNAKPSDVWQIVRGSANVIDKVTNAAFPGQMILHVACQIPSSWLQMDASLTLADINVNKQPIRYAGQVANQMKIGLFARPMTTNATPPKVQCVSTTPNLTTPQQCMYTALWDGYYPQQEDAPTGVKMSLASNTTFVVAQLPANGQPQSLVLTSTPAPSVVFVAVLTANGSVDTTIKVDVMKMTAVEYAVPGNSYPGTYTAIYLNVTIPQGTPSGLRGIQITRTRMPAQVMPGAIYIQ